MKKRIVTNIFMVIISAGLANTLLSCSEKQKQGWIDDIPEHPETLLHRTTIGDSSCILRYDYSNINNKELYFISETDEPLFKKYVNNYLRLEVRRVRDQGMNISDQIKLVIDSLRADVPKYPNARYDLVEMIIFSDDYQAALDEIESFGDKHNFGLIRATLQFMLGKTMDISEADLKADNNFYLEEQRGAILTLVGDLRRRDMPVDELEATILKLAEKVSPLGCFDASLKGDFFVRKDMWEDSKGEPKSLWSYSCPVPVDWPNHNNKP